MYSGCSDGSGVLVETLCVDVLIIQAGNGYKIRIVYGFKLPTWYNC